MSTTNLVRWSGPACLLAGVLQVIGALRHPVSENLGVPINISNWVPVHLVLWAAHYERYGFKENHPHWVSVHVILWVSGLLMLLGLVGLYIRQAEKTGWLGLISFALAFIGIAIGEVLSIASIIIPLFAPIDRAITPQTVFGSSTTTPAFLLPFALGLILFGAAIMSAGGLPRGAGGLLIIGTVLQMMQESRMDPIQLHVMVTIGRVAFGLSFTWIGYVLCSEKR